MIKQSKSNVIKFNVNLILQEDRFTRLGKSTELYFENKDAFDDWIKKNLGDIKVPFGYPFHLPETKRNDEIMEYHRKRQLYIKENGIIQNGFYSSEFINEDIFKVFFSEKELFDILEKESYQKTWFELDIENVMFVENQLECNGCKHGYNNQLGHMDKGGCLSECLD